MKKSILVLTFLVLFSLSFVSSCTLTPTLINQDPYPAIPGDYVNLVFEVNGIGDNSCGNVTFQLIPEYPISFDSDVSSYYSAVGGVYAANFNTYLTIPYTVKISPDAVKGNDTIYFRETTSNFSGYSVTTPFNISVEDVRSNFSVFIKNYDYTTKDLTLNILNTGLNDANSLTVTIPTGQQNITVQGPNTYIIGLLSSNDFTTADFNVLPDSGNINLIISYTDIVGITRSVNETVYFDPSVFPQPSSTSPVLYIVVILAIIIVIYFFYRNRNRKRKKKLLRE